MARKPRKLYAYVRKEQESTPMARLIRSKEGLKIQDANNAGPRKTSLAQNQIKPRSRKWGTAATKQTGGKAVAKYMDKNDVSRSQAKSALKNQTTISFAADPKRK